MERSVTSLETIRIASQGNLVDIPGYADGEMFTVRLRKPNMLTLMKSGRIPNTLLESANGLFQGTKKESTKINSTKEWLDMCELLSLMCEACLVSPTWKELTDAGIELTQEQMLAIFSYSQGGVKSLEPFRNKQGDRKTTRDDSDVSLPSKPVA